MWARGDPLSKEKPNQTGLTNKRSQFRSAADATLDMHIFKNVSPTPIVPEKKFVQRQYFRDPI